MEYRHRAASLEKSMSQLWRMERKRDKNAREMKVQGLGTTPGFSGTPGTHPSSPTQHRPYSRPVVCPTPSGEHSWRVSRPLAGIPGHRDTINSAPRLVTVWPSSHSLGFPAFS